MAYKSFKPYTPGRRQMTVSTFDEITTDKPEKSLLAPVHNHGGRNGSGKMTVRHQGGGHKRQYRIIDFKRNKDNIPAKVATIEYDPNRTCRIALLQYADGEKRYILAPKGLKVGDVVTSGPESDIKVGNCLPFTNIPLGTIVHNVELKIGKGGQMVLNGPEAEVRVGNCLPLSEIPVGTQVHNIELYPGKGGQMVRSAGNGAQLMAKEGDYALLRLPSGELRKVHIRCRATIGVVGNDDHENITLGKAGRNRWLGVRPTTRGVVMNPNDHPHGGGEGKAPVGRKRPVTPWGKPAYGVKTRDNRKASTKLIVKRRK